MFSVVDMIHAKRFKPFMDSQIACPINRVGIRQPNLQDIARDLKSFCYIHKIHIETH